MSRYFESTSTPFSFYGPFNAIPIGSRPEGEEMNAARSTTSSASAASSQEERRMQANAQILDVPESQAYYSATFSNADAGPSSADTGSPRFLASIEHIPVIDYGTEVVSTPVEIEKEPRKMKPRKRYVYDEDLPLDVNIERAFREANEEAAPKSQKFPKKLFKLCNECKSGAIRWGDGGVSVVINYALFQKEYLNKALFKTPHISSFIRQLNLYGFRKTNSNSTGDENALHEFRHNYFRQGREDLIILVQRTLNVKKSKEAKTPRQESEEAVRNISLPRQPVITFKFNRL